MQQVECCLAWQLVMPWEPIWSFSQVGNLRTTSGNTKVEGRTTYLQGIGRRQVWHLIAEGLLERNGEFDLISLWKTRQLDDGW